ncbi:MAG: RidA family protein [Candidatus Omnitrophica bacterium]|nr:RidA family protein [Candidatus Omnitrophota bacterium]
MKIRNNLPVTVRKIVAPGLIAVQISRDGIVEHYITAGSAKAGNYKSTLKQLSVYLKETGTQVLSHFVFGGPETSGNFIAGIQSGAGSRKWPVTFVCGNNPKEEILSGTQLYGVAGASVTPVCLDGRVSGWCYEDKDMRYCLLNDICPGDRGLSRVEQARDTFENMERALIAADLDFSHVVRTWLYLDDMCAWYGAFNQARDLFFRERKVFENIIPASTGIGVRSASGPALVASVFAVKLKGNGAYIRPVVSPLQGSATDYKSSFSRAIEINFPDQRR